MCENKEENFCYSYSAAQREEIEKIKAKYCLSAEDKMEQLRRLDKSAETKGVVVSITVGTISLLLFVLGMVCVFVWESFMILGTLLAIVGFLGMGIAYILHIKITAKERERIAPEILRLADEISGGEITNRHSN